MKAKSLQKKSIQIEDVYKEIDQKNNNCEYKHFIPHFVYVSETVKYQLIEDGFKVYKGDWDAIITECLIIEW